MDENRVTYFAETDARNKKVKFGLKAKDRTRHVYVIGKTGMGKSTLLENMAAQDIQNGEGMAFIDPHGKTADLLLEYVPKERINDVIYLAPFDTDYPISFNVLEDVDPSKRHLVVSGLMSTFKKIWEDAWSARMEYILTNTLLALLECPGTTLLGVNRMLSDKVYRNEIVAQIKDPSVKAFWVKEFANYTERMAAEAIPAIQNKIGQFTANPLIRNMIGQAESSFDIREAMDTRKIMIINLSKGRIGDENMKLLGGLIVTKIYLAAMSRADVPDRVAKMLPNFYLYVDEFQNFANASFADILSEARKYKLNLTIAHQYIEQMDEHVAAAVFGNVGTMIAFRVGATDAEVLEKEFTPQFVLEDLVNLGFTQIYLKLMIDGLTSPPFSAQTLPPIPHPDISYFKEIIDASRAQFARPRAAVEAEIVKFHNPEPAPKKAPEAGSKNYNSPAPKVATPPAKPMPTSVSTPVPPPAVVSPVKPPMAPVSAMPVSAPTLGAVPPPSSAPAPAAPRAEIHKPFSQAFAKMNTPSPVVSRNDSDHPHDDHHDHVQVKPPIIDTKPVSLSSLSSLSKNSSPTNNHKVQHPANVSGLKNALADILKKVPPKAASVQPQTSQPAVSVTPPAPQTENTNSPSQPNPLTQPPQSTSQQTVEQTVQTKEVPEDVLNKVLE